MRRAVLAAATLALAACGTIGDAPSGDLPAVAPGELVTVLRPGENGLRDDAGFTGLTAAPDGTVYVGVSKPGKPDEFDRADHSTMLVALRPDGKQKTVEEISYLGTPGPPPTQQGLAGGREGVVYVADVTRAYAFDPVVWKRGGLSTSSDPDPTPSDTHIETVLAASPKRVDTPAVHVAWDDRNTALFVAGRHSVVRVDADGTATTVAGVKEVPPFYRRAGSFLDEGRPPTEAQFAAVGGIAVDPRNGDLYVGTMSTIVRVSRDGAWGVVVKGRVTGDLGDGGPAADARLAGVEGLAVDPASGSLYVADRAHCRIREINATGIISTIAGGGCDAPTAERGRADGLLLTSPRDIAVDQRGRLFVTNVFPPRVYMIGLGKG